MDDAVFRIGIGIALCLFSLPMVGFDFFDLGVGGRNSKGGWNWCGTAVPPRVLPYLAPATCASGFSRIQRPCQYLPKITCIR